jgi:hypothetical protein
MPKTLFYAGVVVALFLALLSFREALMLVSTTGARDAVSVLAAAITRRAMLTAGLLLLSIPFAALFVRMAALIAARNVFAAFFTLFFSACTALSFAVIAAAEWRFSTFATVARVAVDVTNRFGDLRAIAFALCGFFLVLTLLSSRAYFRVQASRLLSTLLYFPALLYLPLLLENRDIDAFRNFFRASPLSFLFLSLLGAIFFGVGIHCLRHRHLFLEVTNLRELLDTRMVDGEKRQRFGFGHDVAFDS